jgi:hypothetical protein
VRKIVCPVSKETLGGRRYRVYIEIICEGGALRMHGVEGPLPGGNCFGGAGQIDMHLREEDRTDWRFLPGWNPQLFDRLLDIWDRWHLNDPKERPLPSEVIAFLDSLPASRTKPAWI